MTRLVIVPDSLRAAINDAIDQARVRAGISVEAMADSHELIYQGLLKYFDEHGRIPSIDLIKTPSTEAT